MNDADTNPTPEWQHSHGSSRQLIVGPEGSISTLVVAAVLPLAVAGGARASGSSAAVDACTRAEPPE